MKLTELIENPQVSFDYCIKCTICNTVCPVSSVFPYFPGPKYLGPDSERYRLQNRFPVEDVSAFCMNCKRCEEICPSDVQITHFIEEDKFRQKKTFRKKLRSLFFIYIDLVGKLASSVSILTNIVLKLGIVRLVMEWFLAIEKKRRLPEYNSGTFLSYFRKNYRPPEKPAMTVHFFHGCNINYNQKSLGVDFLKFCHRHNIEVKIPPQKCCGIPIASAGDAEAYRKRVDYHFPIFWDILRKGDIITGVSSSCIMAINTDYLRHIPLDEENKERYHKGIVYFNDLLEIMEKNGIPLKIEKKYKRLIYHVPCHVKYSTQQAKTIALLRRLTDNLVILDEYCCGIAGSYGMKKENYIISQNIGSQLFQQINSHLAEGDGLLVSDCETCRMQIAENTKKKIYHPLELIENKIPE